MEYNSETDLPQYFVYCYRSKINGKTYIGKTGNIKKRQATHIRRAFIENQKTTFYNALRKYGKDNFEFIILDSFWSEDIIFELEKFYISAGKSNQKEFGYNLTSGGEGSSGTFHNENQIRANKLKIGQDNGNSKLTNILAIEIFNKYKTGCFTIKQLSLTYNVSQVTIERLLSGKSWKHLKLNIKSLEDAKKKNIFLAPRRGTI